MGASMLRNAVNRGVIYDAVRNALKVKKVKIKAPE
jgi:hypothetical protein